MLVARGILRLRKELNAQPGESHLSNFLDSASLLEIGLVFIGDDCAGLRRSRLIPAVLIEEVNCPQVKNSLGEATPSGVTDHRSQLPISSI